MRSISPVPRVLPKIVPTANQAATDRLAAGARDAVAATGTRAADRTRKLLVRLRDGATVETVLIPGVSGERRLGRGVQDETESDDADAAAAVDDEDDDEDQGDENPQGKSYLRVTQCISTQVGCAMGCVFCASGVAGLKRNLGPDEIVAQVLAGKAELDDDERLRNIVYMGMGEPLHNYASTVRSLRLLTHADGLAISPRRITVSTSGLVPEIAKLGADFAGQIGLAISLHAADDETRCLALTRMIGCMSGVPPDSDVKNVPPGPPPRICRTRQYCLPRAPSFPLLMCGVWATGAILGVEALAIRDEWNAYELAMALDRPSLRSWPASSA